MQRSECVAFLQWCLPRLRMRWPGFRRVRSQVCKRVARRIAELGLDDLEAYRRFLASHPGEWTALDSMCRVTISRFVRDRGVFETLATEVLPALAAQARERGGDRLRAWSCGCASGEEPYSLALLWHFRLATLLPDLELDVVATDSDLRLLQRARAGVYGVGSLKEVPAAWQEAAFAASGHQRAIRQPFREDITWCCQDVRQAQPTGPFDLVLCRNLVFTYYEPTLQLELALRLADLLRPGGAMVIGSHESLPAGVPAFERWIASEPVFRRL